MNQLTLEALVEVFQRSGEQTFPNNVSVVCAVSGGLDSMVLAHLMSQSGCVMRAVHIDHAAHPDSADWANRVSTWMSTLNVQTRVHRIEPAPDHRNLEAYWRAARQAAFEQEVGTDEILLTAHHQDDQAETVLLQLMRGAGPTGLQAMPASKRLSNGSVHLRPLLEYSRKDLENYAQANQLEWLDDPSNTNQRHDRNYLRHRVLPALTERWPGAVKAISRSAKLIGESALLDEEQAKKDAQIDGPLLDWARLAPLSSVRQANAVRYWLSLLGLRYPNQRRLNEALRQWNTADSDRLPELALECGTIQRYRNSLVYAQDRAPVAEGWEGDLRAGQWLNLPSGLGQLGLMGAHHELSGLTGDRVTSLLLGADPHLTVRFRSFGERLRRASQQHQSLKHWFQDAGIPPVLRSRWPLVYLEGELMAIAGCWVDARFRSQSEPAPGQKNYSLIWRQPSSLEAK